MAIIQVEDLKHPGLRPYVALTDNQLRNRLNAENALFIAESPKVIRTALAAGYEPVSMLCEPKHIEGDAADIVELLGPDIPVYTGNRELLSSLTGYALTRGVLCAMHRPLSPTLESTLEGARCIAVLDGVCDTTNIGSIFRSAAALGLDAIVLTPTACDPLNRRSIRVSMGSVFLIPWTFATGDWQKQLQSMGFTTAAMALRNDSIALDNAALKSADRLAIILGTEGDGLDDSVISHANHVVRIPMHHDVDSLNVATAAAIAFWELCK